MTPEQTKDKHSHSASANVALVLAAGAILGTLAWAAWAAEQRALARRPSDSAPSRARRGALTDNAAQSMSATIAAPLPAVLGAITDDAGLVLPRELLGDDQVQLRPIQHDGDDVVSWRSEDGVWLVKLILRPVRGDRMTSVTAIVAREENGILPLSLFGPASQSTLKQSLTRFRMRFETGELARAS